MLLLLRVKLSLCNTCFVLQWYITNGYRPFTPYCFSNRVSLESRRWGKKWVWSVVTINLSDPSYARLIFIQSIFILIWMNKTRAQRRLRLCALCYYCHLLIRKTWTVRQRTYLVNCIHTLDPVFALVYYIPATQHCRMSHVCVVPAWTVINQLFNWVCECIFNSVK